jgi:hypothetical protein
MSLTGTQAAFSKNYDCRDWGHRWIADDWIADEVRINYGQVTDHLPLTYELVCRLPMRAQQSQLCTQMVEVVEQS